jgi:hypothetical protein
MRGCLLLVLLVGCETRASDPIEGVLTFDASQLPAVDGGRAADAGPPGIDASTPVELDAGMIIVNDDGVLTNEPTIQFVNTGITTLVITSASFRMFQRDDGGWSFFWAGELENRGANTHCIVDIEANLGGMDVLTVVDSAQYAITDSIGVTRLQCMAPGEKGVFWGIENDLFETFVDSIFTVFYEPSSLIRNEAYHDPARPLLTDADAFLTEESTWGVRASFTLGSIPVYNFTATFYPRAGGLLWNAITVYHLEDVPAFGSFEADSFSGNEFYFDDHQHTVNYLVRRGMGAVGYLPPSPLTAAWRARHAEARARLERRAR